MPQNSQVIKSTVLFVLAFGLHQIANLSNVHLTQNLLQALSSLAIIFAAIAVMKKEVSGFSKHGFLLPKKAIRFLAMSLSLAIFFVVVVIFIPGSLSGFEALPGAAFSWDLLLAALNILLASIAVESIFRGYIQVSLEDSYGFPVALVVVSVLFAFYMFPLNMYSGADLTNLLYWALPIFVESVFFCFFFKETRTLLCTVAFSSATTFLIVFTPLQPVTIEYSTLASVATYLLLVPVTQVLVAEIKENNSRYDPSPITDSEYEERFDMRAF